MKTGLIIGFLCAGTAFAGTASIVGSFRVPGKPGNVLCIDYYDGYIYHAECLKAIYKTTTSGVVIGTIRTPAIGTGIDRTENEFWTCGPIVGIINRLTTTGSLSYSWSTQIDWFWDITFDGEYLWLPGFRERIYGFTTRGSLIASFRYPSRNPICIYWASPYLWLGDNGPTIFQGTMNGSIVETFKTSHKPWGITSDGNYFWYNGGYTGYVYKVILRSTNAIGPASLGKVKALYR
jgi:hypothetical protein